MKTNKKTNKPNVNFYFCKRVNIARAIKRWTAIFFDFYDDTELYESLLMFIKQIDQKKKRNAHALEILNEAINAFREASEIYKTRMVC